MARRCKRCDTEIPSASQSLTVPNKKKFCGIDCMVSWGLEESKRRLVAKQQREKEKAERYAKEFRERAPKNKRELDRKDLKWQEDRTQTAFNRMRVQQELLWFYSRGIEPYCISCQKTKMDFCCGHNKTRGSNSFLQFDESNTFLQCNKACNSSLSGNINGTSTSVGYLEGLRQRFGKSEGQSIINYCEQSPTLCKRTAEEFESLRKGFNAEFRRLKPLVERSKFEFQQTQ